MFGNWKSEIWKLEIWKFRNDNFDILKFGKCFLRWTCRVPHVLSKFVKMGTRNKISKNHGYEFHIYQNMKWKFGNFCIFSSKGIPSTPQHTDSHPCTRPGWSHSLSWWSRSQNVVRTSGTQRLRVVRHHFCIFP